VEAEIVDQISHSHRNGNGLISCYASQRSSIEMIEVGVGHENKIDRGQMMNFKAGLLQSLDYLEPF